MTLIKCNNAWQSCSEQLLPSTKKHGGPFNSQDHKLFFSRFLKTACKRDEKFKAGGIKCRGNPLDKILKLKFLSLYCD